jgi:tetratricopeptide (TPR) repeat protein
MRRKLLAFVLICAAVSFAPRGYGQAAPGPGTVQPGADSFKNEAMVFERYDTTYRMNADGTGERDIHAVLRVQSESAAQKFSVLSISYASANETPKIQFVRVHKPDGTTVETPASDAIDMTAEVSREAPLYSDLKEKHVPVRSLSAGDTLEYEVDTAITQPDVPGQFWGADHFTAPGTLVVLDETLTLTFPAGKYVQVWSPNHKATMTEKDGLRTYMWTVPQLIPAPHPSGDNSKPTLPKDPDQDGDGRSIPSVAWTTFHNWAEVGDWYRGLELTQSHPSDAIKAKANEIAANAKDPEGEVRAIYEFVSMHTRYVGIDFGIGRYKPHAAQEVLIDQYGDCKDKDTLLEALLQARGFSTSPALIGAGIAPVPDVPSPATFNHVITTVNLPSGRIWLDSTLPGAPYRYLSDVIRDQKALIVPPQAPASLESTPAEAPYPLTARFEATAEIDQEGKLNGKIVATYRDDEEPMIRVLARTLAPADRDQATQYLSSAFGFSGTASDTSFQNADDPTQPIVLTYSYSKHPFGDWDNLRILPLFPVLDLQSIDDDKAPDSDIELGAPRTLTAVTRIKLPDGYRTDLPDPIHVNTAFATFDKSYRFDGKEIVIERTVVVIKKKVAKEDWKKYSSFTKDISLNDEQWIQLIKPSKPIVIVEKSDSALAAPGASKSDSAGAAKSPGVVDIVPEKTSPIAKSATPSAASDRSIADLMAELPEKLRASDWADARQILDQVKAKNPKQPGLWAMYGYIAQAADRDNNEAIADLQKELENEPDNQMVVSQLALLQNQTGDAAGAQATLQKFSAAHPDNLPIAMYLGNLELRANNYEGALKTFETAADQNPDDRTARIQVAETLVRLQRMDEAAAAAKSALDGALDAESLNDAAYTLSETGRDLPTAEDASRKSIGKLEEQSASITTDQANSKAFASANLLVAAWDTLGWILNQEGKYDDAKSWLSPAWRASLSAEVGSHLAQVDEKLGKNEEAAETFKLAQAAIDKNTLPNVAHDIRDGLLRTGVKLPADRNPQFPMQRNIQESQSQESLQKLRTYTVKRATGASGWGSFRLEITTAGVIESQRMSGDQKLEALKPVINAMKFPELLPPDSKAHLLRSAVVSCSGETCDVVLVPDGGLQTEQP